jgi:hypothetical protein
MQGSLQRWIESSKFWLPFVSLLSLSGICCWDSSYTEDKYRHSLCRVYFWWAISWTWAMRWTESRWVFLFLCPLSQVHTPDIKKWSILVFIRLWGGQASRVFEFCVRTRSKLWVWQWFNLRGPILLPVSRRITVIRRSASTRKKTNRDLFCRGFSVRHWDSISIAWRILLFYENKGKISEKTTPGTHFQLCTLSKSANFILPLTKICCY